MELETTTMVIGGLVSSEMVVTGEDMRLLFNEEDEGANILSSVTSVLSNYDLLFEILLRLPALSLVLFKSVSKHWFNIITSPRFIKLRREIPNTDPPPFALLTQRIDDDLDWLHCNFESFDIRIPSKKSVEFTQKLDLEEPYVRILHSCNGLLLCEATSYNSFFVYNPTINQFRRILPPRQSRNDSARLVFDPTKSPHYKIILSQQLMYRNFRSGLLIKFHTYHSEKDTWSVCGDTFCGHSFFGFRGGVYWNDAIHWLNAYTAYNGKLMHHKLDIQCEQLVLTKLELPVTCDLKSELGFGTNLVTCDLKSELDFRTKLFESRGCLLLLGKDCAHSSQLNVYEMRHGYTEWSVKYIVNLDDIVMPLRTPCGIPRPTLCSIVLGERQEDSFVIIELYGKVVQYNPVLKTVRTLQDDLNSLLGYSYYFQLIASFALV